MAHKANQTSFKPGHPGGPGRPPGHRNKLSEAFIRVLCEDFESNGADVIQRLREEQPAQYANVIAKLMPKLMELSGPDGGPVSIGIISFADVTAEQLDT